MKRSRGFSLLELVMVIVLLSILAAVSLPMLTTGFAAFSQQRASSAVEREAKLALERISREVRIGQEFSGGGASLGFERDGLPMEIRLDGNELVLDRDGSASVLARNVSSLNVGTEIHEGACYVLVTFATAGVAESWRSATFARNSTCND